MFCKYCGKPIDEDSHYCRYCGQKVCDGENSFKYLVRNHIEVCKENMPSKLSKIHITKEQILSVLNFIWKVIKTIVFAFVGLIVYLLVGFVMSPFIALFSAEIPSLGIIDEIEKIWKKENDSEAEASE